MATTRAPGTRSGRENTPICSTWATSRTSTFSASCRSTDASTSSSAPSLPPGSAQRPCVRRLAPGARRARDSAPSRICSTAASTSCSVPTSAILGRDLHVPGRGRRARASRAAVPARQMRSRSRGGCARGARSGYDRSRFTTERRKHGRRDADPHVGRGGARARAPPRRGAARAQLPAAGDPGRRRPRRRLAGAVPDRGRARRRRRSSSAACTSWPRPRRSSRRTRPCSSRTPRAGCSLADSITADQLRAWKAEHPGAVVVSYVNTTAAVKAETDVCCTSSNAVEVVASIPADREVLFLPDQFLGAHVRRVTGPGEPARLGGGVPRARRASTAPSSPRRPTPTPTPSCTSTPSAAARPRRSTWPGAGAVPAERVQILSTGGMLDAARSSSAREVLVATEVGMLHQLRRAAPEIDFRAVNDRASCRYMKMITPEKLLRACARAATRCTSTPSWPPAAARRRPADDRDRQRREAASERPGRPRPSWSSSAPGWPGSPPRWRPRGSACGWSS